MGNNSGERVYGMRTNRMSHRFWNLGDGRMVDAVV